MADGPSGALRIAITGATGLIGRAATDYFRQRGHVIVPVSRQRLPGGVQWDPARGLIDARTLEGVDAVLHLAGESLANGRWTAHRRRVLRDSRVQSTRLISEAITELRFRPRVLLSASAIGIYGDQGDTMLDETAPFGNDFLAELCVSWEAAAAPAAAADVRVVHPRFGIVLSKEGGALAKLLPPFRLGLGGPLGSGRQWMSWITMDDLLGAVDYLLRREKMVGAVNVVAPGATRNLDFATALGKALDRPAIIPVPALALRLALGAMADGTVLASQRGVPARLVEGGFAFRYPELEVALRRVLERRD